MSRFKINQKVVCVDDKNQHNKSVKIHKDNVVKNKTYTIKDIQYLRTEGLMFKEVFGGKFSDGSECGFKSSRFAPIQEDGSTKKLVEEIIEEGVLEELGLHELELN